MKANSVLVLVAAGLTMLFRIVVALPTGDCTRDNDCGENKYCDNVIGMCDDCVAMCSIPIKENDCKRHCKDTYEKMKSTLPTPKAEPRHQMADPEKDPGSRDYMTAVYVALAVAGVVAITGAVVVGIIYYRKNPQGHRPMLHSQDTDGNPTYRTPSTSCPQEQQTDLRSSQEELAVK